MLSGGSLSRRFGFDEEVNSKHDLGSMDSSATHDLVYIFKTMSVIETGHRFCIDKNLTPLQTLKMNAPSMTIVNSKQFKGNDKFDFELDKYD